jgi:bifunctional DNA-binding transcriptional regulator/antitoxin component of YhaV-PrlF toxin-antitoxin module
MAEEIIQSNLSEGDQIEIDYDEDKKEIVVKTIKPKSKKKKEDN